MEAKTMGSFIAALRKASGMTQKDLAERLNVSDKSVSRWERDDGAPDLSLIPVIAEIFGVTCDELLRGQRKSPQQSQAPQEQTGSARGEKQLRRILAVGLSRYKTHTLISVGVSISGLIAAMICNFGFLRAYIGFLVGCLFYLAGIITQAIWINAAFLSVSDDGLPGAEVTGFKNTVIRLAEWSMGLSICLLGLSLPLILLPWDAYQGLEAGSWFASALATGLMALLFVAILRYFLHPRLLKKGVLHMTEKDERTYWHNHVLQKKCALLLACLLAFTGINHLLANLLWANPYTMADGIRFDNFADFKAYMEQDIPYQSISGTPMGMTASVEVCAEPADEISYFDMDGNEITEEEWYTETITDSQGRVLCSYQARNRMVAHMRYDGDDGLPITIITFDDLAAAQSVNSLVNAAFVFAYLLELAVVFILYRKKRAV